MATDGKHEIANGACQPWPDKTDFRLPHKNHRSRYFHPLPRPFLRFSSSSSSSFGFARSLSAAVIRSFLLFFLARVNQHEKGRLRTQYATDWSARLSVAYDCLRSTKKSKKKNVKENVPFKGKKQSTRGEKRRIWRIGESWKGEAPFLRFILPKPDSLVRFWCPDFVAFHSESTFGKNAVDINRVTGCIDTTRDWIRQLLEIITQRSYSFELSVTDAVCEK